MPGLGCQLAPTDTISQLLSNGAFSPALPTPSPGAADGAPLRQTHLLKAVGSAGAYERQEAFLLVKPEKWIQGSHPSMRRPECCLTRQMVNLSQELGASYKNGSFLEIR